MQKHQVTLQRIILILRATCHNIHLLRGKKLEQPLLSHHWPSEQQNLLLQSFKKQEPSSNHVIQYHDLKGDNIITYIKIPVLTTEHHYFGKRGKLIVDIIDTLSSKKSDIAGTVWRLTKALVHRDRLAVLEGLEDMTGIRVL